MGAVLGRVRGRRRDARRSDRTELRRAHLSESATVRRPARLVEKLVLKKRKEWSRTSCSHGRVRPVLDSLDVRARRC